MGNASKQTPFRSVLVANRGEIALRIMKTARLEGLRTVAVYTRADANAEFVEFADQAVFIGEGPVKDSYLSVEKIIEAAKNSGAEAIHPGYGFLSETAEFAQSCLDAGLVFIGPNAATIKAMGDKANAKVLMQKAGISCVPGYEGEDQSLVRFQAAADEIGFPVMIKAAAGGGGRGMRLVENQADFAASIETACNEAEQSFGSGKLILEKAIEKPRHIEVQIFADRQGNIIHLGERDCSVQRRHQKVIEEAPAPGLSDELRRDLAKTAIQVASAVKYEGAGTVEFLLGADGQFYFLEMNTRLQVEHPVTEAITGLDLVSLQFAVARGEPLPVSQPEVQFSGHAMEARLYAEDPVNGFMPASGRIALWQAPQNVRIDSGIRTGEQVSPYYDPMLAKITAWGETRDATRLALINALQSTALFGLKCNRDFLIDLLKGSDFALGNATTAYISDRYGEAGPQSPLVSSHDLVAFAALWYQNQQSIVARTAGIVGEMQGWASSGVLHSRLVLGISGERHVLRISQNRQGVTIEIGDEIFKVNWQGSDVIIDNHRQPITAYLDSVQTLFLALPDHTLTIDKANFGNRTELQSSSGNILAPMHGSIAKVFVAKGDKVAKGQRLAILEAMKMQHELLAKTDGIVIKVLVSNGQQVEADDLVIEMSEDSNA